MRSRAQICRLAQERASHVGKIGNEDLRKVHAKLLNASTAFIASLHYHLSSHTRSPLLSVLTGTALKMRSAQPHTSSSALSACCSIYSVDMGVLVWCPA